MTTAQQQASGWQESDRDEVFAWRRSQLARYGFQEPLAARLAQDARYDLHELMKLVDGGCPPELALRILAPLEEEEAA